MTEIVFHDNTSQEIRDLVLDRASKWKPYNRGAVICGFIKSDADYMTTCNIPNGLWKCPLYVQWNSMLTRCYSGRYPRYEGCVVDDVWHSFMAFRSWSLANGWASGYQLDKDYLSTTDKVYSPNTCAWVPLIVNSFIIDRKADRGDLPIGVKVNRSGTYGAQVSNPLTNKQEYIGTYQTPEDAHAAWKHKKCEHANMLANLYHDLNPRLLEALRTRYLE